VIAALRPIPTDRRRVPAATAVRWPRRCRCGAQAARLAGVVMITSSISMLIALDRGSIDGTPRRRLARIGRKDRASRRARSDLRAIVSARPLMGLG